ncbi:MAG: HAD family phosphatase [Sedimentisphaerales bacterium]|jgi:beta-phosphoglucomutase|nr:HAD family phosphatase [Sedimentisphaerales bacterium]
MLKAAVFDFDGVLADSEMVHLEAFNLALARFGVQIGVQQYMDLYLGLTDRECVETVISQGLLEVDAQTAEALVADKKRIYGQLARAETRLIDGVLPFLQMLSSHGIHMAICSGALKEEILAFTDRTNLTGYFKVIVSADDVTKGKPDPEGFLLTLARLNDLAGPIKPQDCVVIEDSRWGIAAAWAAGMHTVAVTNTYGPSELAQADLIVSRLDQLSIDDLHRLTSR